jgi:hypothetical protein
MIRSLADTEGKKFMLHYKKPYYLFFVPLLPFVPLCEVFTITLLFFQLYRFCCLGGRDTRKIQGSSGEQFITVANRRDTIGIYRELIQAIRNNLDNIVIGIHAANVS